MRMWMVDPAILCRRHLLGEHAEHHMFVGTLKRRLQMDGYVQNNLVELRQLEARHNALVEEMTKRGMNHQSPLPFHDITYLPMRIQDATVDVDSALADLLGRCSECKARWESKYGHKVHAETSAN